MGGTMECIHEILVAVEGTVVDWRGVASTRALPERFFLMFFRRVFLGRGRGIFYFWDDFIQTKLDPLQTMGEEAVAWGRKKY